LGPKPHKKGVINVYISLWHTQNINNNLVSLEIDNENITSTARIEALSNVNPNSRKGEVELTLSWPAVGYYNRNLLQALFLPPESH
jgi:hypothetical protein